MSPLPRESPGNKVFGPQARGGSLEVTLSSPLPRTKAPRGHPAATLTESTLPHAACTWASGVQTGPRLPRTPSSAAQHTVTAPLSLWGRGAFQGHVKLVSLLSDPLSHLPLERGGEGRGEEGRGESRRQQISGPGDLGHGGRGPGTGPGKGRPVSSDSGRCPLSLVHCGRTVKGLSSEQRGPVGSAERRAELGSERSGRARPGTWAGRAEAQRPRASAKGKLVLAVARAQGRTAEAPGRGRVARGCPSGRSGEDQSQALPGVLLPAQTPGGPRAPCTLLPRPGASPGSARDFVPLVGLFPDVPHRVRSVHLPPGVSCLGPSARGKGL